MAEATIEHSGSDARQHLVVLVHGLGGNQVETERLGKRLQQAGFAVHAPQIPGFTAGTGETRWEDWCAHLVKTLTALRPQYRGVSLVGISMGATLALAAALSSPRSCRLDGLVLLGPALAYDGWALPWYSFLIHVLPLVPLKSRYVFHERHPFGLKNPGLREQIRKQLQSGESTAIGTGSMPMNALEQGFRLIRHVWRRLDKVPGPVLLIHAVDDETVSILSAETAFARLTAPHKEMIYLGDSYHMITVDNERETVFYETERFLKQCANEAAGQQVFELPPALSRDLRRRVKTAEQGGHEF
jgi:carboxylesterase